MTTKEFKNENYDLLNKYDEVINITMVNLYTLCKDNETIILSNIDRTNSDHVYILRVALLARDIYGFPLKLKTGFWNWIVLNWRMRKLSRRVPRYTGEDSTVDINDLIEFMYAPVRNYLGEEFKFSDIYNEFYKGELD